MKNFDGAAGRLGRFFVVASLFKWREFCAAFLVHHFAGRGPDVGSRSRRQRCRVDEPSSRHELRELS